MSQDHGLQKRRWQFVAPFPSAPRICGLVDLRAGDGSMSSDISQPEMLCVTSGANVTGVMSQEIADRWHIADGSYRLLE